jgi:hypothetical protein
MILRVVRDSSDRRLNLLKNPDWNLRFNYFAGSKRPA